MSEAGPILVFDSGIGGLSVLRAARAMQPRGDGSWGDEVVGETEFVDERGDRGAARRERLGPGIQVDSRDALGGELAAEAVGGFQEGHAVPALGEAQGDEEAGDASADDRRRGCGFDTPALRATQPPSPGHE